MERTKIAAGNWKMNKTLQEGVELARALVKGTKAGKALVILGTPYIHLAAVSEVIRHTAHIRLAAQNCSDHESGAYTGEISAAMLRSAGAAYVIIGHSERRAIFGESNKLLARKVDIALRHGLKPIFCCGEPLSIRQAGTHASFVSRQLRAGLFHLSEKQMSEVVIAYEPIWAIGTGVTASPAQAQEIQQRIRQLLAQRYSEKTAGSTSILYGGSVKPGNAREIFSQPDVDGGLVGGASLKASDFIEIIRSF